MFTYRLLIAAFSFLLISNLSFAEPPKGKVVSTASVVYGKDKQGNKLTGILSLIMTKGKTVRILGRDHLRGTFLLHLEMREGKDITTPLAPLITPLAGPDEIAFQTELFPIVTTDFNKDGISEFNFGQPGNSWGDHYMLFTFAKDGSGKIAAMTVSKEKEFNYLHPESGMPSTNALRETKEGFCHSFTERGDPIAREVDIHFRWDAKSNRFVEFKRVER